MANRGDFNMTISTFIVNDIQLLIDDTTREAFEAFASVSLNPNLTWIKFVLTDDKPNVNGHRIPKEEFANIIKTGVYMPLKMAEGEISENHEGTIPLGVMTHLINKGDRIEALAALWFKERTEDVEFLRERFADGKEIDISWEISFVGSEEQEEGHLDLRNVSMNAATIVGMPSYAGRTNVQALASDGKQSSLEDKNTMDTITLDKHEEILTALRESNDNVVKDLNTQLTQAADDTKELESKVSDTEKELKTLRTFKEEADAATEREQKMVSIREKFAGANIKADDDYFDSRKDVLLAMSDEQLDFFVQEIASSLASAGEENAEASVSLTGDDKTPDVRGTSKDEITPEDVVEYLREQDKS